MRILCESGESTGFSNDRSSPPEMFSWKGVLKICSKFTVEHPCWSVISIKLQICCIFLEYLFLRTCLEGVFWYTNIVNTSSFNDKYSSLNTFCNLIIKKDYFDLYGDVNIIILISILLIIVLVDWLSLKGVNHIHDYLYFHVHVFKQLQC